MAKRKARNKASKKVDITKPLDPIDVSKLGGDDDPCFGKHHDLTAEECKRCGDSPLCSIIQNQKTIKMREEEESTSRFKDLELDKPKKSPVQSYIEKKLERKRDKDSIIKQIIKRFDLSKEEAKETFKTVNKSWKK